MKTKVFWFALPLMIFALISYGAFGQTAAMRSAPAKIILVGYLDGQARGGVLKVWFSGKWVQSTSRQTDWVHISNPASLLTAGDIDGDKTDSLPTAIAVRYFRDWF